MKLKEFIKLKNDTKLYHDWDKVIRTKLQVLQKIRFQTVQDICAGVGDAEIKERIKSMINLYELVPLPHIIKNRTTRLFMELNLK